MNDLTFFKFSRQTFLIIMLLSLTTVMYSQQLRTITGHIKDETEEPVPGASIKCGEHGTISDFDGNFSLEAPSNGTIEVSYIGYSTQKININDQKTFLITLKENVQLLNEVVVVGYGSQRVKDLTGAASPVKFDDLESLPGASIADALSGQVIGLNVTQSSGRPGETGSITIRQPAPALYGSVNYSPLIVIDDIVQVDENGEPDMTAFNMLDYSEIESMTVLKDASAAVYGSRASQGVILIKTKRGAQGKPKITYSGKVDFSDAISHSKVMNSYETGVFTNRMFNQLKANNGADYTNYNYSDTELNRMKSLNYDWLDKAWSSAVSHRHSISVNGGSENTTFFAGINYQKQNTNLGEVQDYDKWTFRTGGEMKVASGLKLSASISGYNNEQVKPNYQIKIAGGPWGKQSNANDYVQLRHMPQFMPYEVTTGRGTYYMSPYVGPHYVYNYQSDNSVDGYPLWNFFANEASKARNTEEGNGFNTNFSLIYDVPFIKGLQLKGTYAISYNNIYSNEVGDYYQLALATNTDKSDMHLIGDYTTWAYPSYGRKDNVNNGPTVRFNKKTIKSEQINFMLTYNRTFGEHDLGVTGVIERAENEGNEQQTTYKSPMDSYNGTSNFAGTLQTGSSDTYFKKYESGALSYIGRANYKYSNRYLFQFIIRADASTKFAPENYWGIFPTGSAGWVLSEEKFYKDSRFSKYVNYLKLRYSLGKTGKDNVKAWSWLNVFNTNTQGGLAFGPNAGEPTLGAMYNGTANRDIKWDQTIKHNVGLDVNFLRDRLGVTVDYFYDKTTDMLMLLQESPALVYIGATRPAVNYGAVDAWGWEFSLSWKDKINQDLFPKMGPIRYGVQMNYGISAYEVKIGETSDFDYPSIINDKSSWTGYTSPNSEYGFKVWKGTSGGDGILRTQADINNYWSYLEQNAIASGGSAGDASYFEMSKDQMYVGMLAYQDLAGDLNVENKTINGPNGRIERSEDYAKLANNRRHNINTKLNFQWGDFSLATQIATSWGGFSSIYCNVKQDISNSSIIWSQFSYMTDMFDPDTNPSGKYPSMAVSNSYGEVSDFWKVSSFRSYIRFLTLGYTLPNRYSQRAGIDKLQVTLTGNNLWDFYNPYPNKFRNMYDEGNAAYPTLRTWTLGLNVTF